MCKESKVFLTWRTVVAPCDFAPDTVLNLQELQEHHVLDTAASHNAVISDARTFQVSHSLLAIHR